MSENAEYEIYNIMTCYEITSNDDTIISEAVYFKLFGYVVFYFFN